MCLNLTRHINEGLELRGTNVLTGILAVFFVIISLSEALRFNSGGICFFQRILCCHKLGAFPFSLVLIIIFVLAQCVCLEFDHIGKLR